MELNVVSRIDDRVPVRRVIISVANKDGLGRLAPPLVEIIPEIVIYSTGATYKALSTILGGADHLVRISDYTGQPEMQGGLVKTLDFRIYLGLLSETYNPEHEKDLGRAEAATFDMVVGNLYPFRQAIARLEATPETARGNIDIGGPCMIRAAAKNFLRVAAMVDAADYEPILAELRENGGRLTLETRFRLAKKAFAHTADYDTAISRYLSDRSCEEILRCYTLEG